MADHDDVMVRRHASHRRRCVVLAVHQVQLVLRDLDLHGDDGFRLLSATTDAEMRVVVVSAHADRALQAFEVGVLDFVAKPVNAAGLLLALGRVQPAFRIRRANNMSPNETRS